MEKPPRQWRCKRHGICRHDIFINYRVWSDAETAAKIALFLNSERLQGEPVTCFLDKLCLVDGENWQVGFLNGLKYAKLLVLLISEDGISGIRQAHTRQDNVLLEYEHALDRLEKGECLILPLLLGKTLDGGLYKDFGQFDVSVYPDEAHTATGKNIRQTMKALFRLGAEWLRVCALYMVCQIEHVCVCVYAWF